MSWFKKKKIVSFLVSGSGLLFSHVAHMIQSRRIPARIGVMLTDSAGAGALVRAKKLRIDGHFVDRSAFPDSEEFDDQLLHILDECNTDLIVAAGYLRMLSPHFVRQYRNRIINIHPSLLPSFPGLGSQEKALEYGVKVSGCTAHFVDEGMDTGPIILQSPVMIAERDTVHSLSERILREEFRILAESVRLFCEDKLLMTGRKVTIVK